MLSGRSRLSAPTRCSKGTASGREHTSHALRPCPQHRRRPSGVLGALTGAAGVDIAPLASRGGLLTFGDDRYLVQPVGHAGVPAGSTASRPGTSLDCEQTHLVVAAPLGLIPWRVLCAADAAGGGQCRHL